MTDIEIIRNLTPEQKSSILEVLKMGCVITFDQGLVELQVLGQSISPEYCGISFDTGEYPVTLEGLDEAIEDIYWSYNFVEGKEQE